MRRGARSTTRAAALGVLCALALFAIDATAAWSQGACPPGVVCGTVTVPLDRANPSAGTIGIAYAVVPHTDTGRPPLGTIVPNPGGPGQSTIAFAGLYLGALAPLLTRRDLLLIDPRGTGQSGPLQCPSLAGPDPLSLDVRAIARLCGADLGPRARFYGTAAVADDIDAVRAALGVDKVDLWGDSYGTFLMPVYAARHPAHVRSIVLDGAFPVAADRWGRDVLRGVRRVLGLVCARTRRCTGARVLGRVGRLARRLRRDPISFTAHSPIGRVPLTIGERELANLTFGFGDPRVYGWLPAAVAAALHGDPALLKRMVAAFRIDEAGRFFNDPAVVSIGDAAAVECHDYPRPYSVADPPAQRRRQYRRALAALDRAQFRPFAPRAWLGADIDAGPKCLDWPVDATAGSPLRGHRTPAVPVLVQSGDLDTNTPVEQGRRAAAQFRHPTFAIVANAGHTPDLHACGAAMAIDFIRHLTTDATRCRHVGRPPRVIGRPAMRAAHLRLPRARAAPAVLRAVAVALATVADERAIATYTGRTGTLDALRGGIYVVNGRRVRFVAARVVRDAAVDGTLRTHRHVTRARLRLRGPGVRRSRLTLRIGRQITHVTGTVGGRRVSVRLAASGN